MNTESVEVFVRHIRELYSKRPKVYVISRLENRWSHIETGYISTILQHIRREMDANPQGEDMKYASAFYVASPSVEIYVFVDEEASGLPEGAAEICKDVKTVDEFLDLVEPYFILAKDK